MGLCYCTGTTTQTWKYAQTAQTWFADIYVKKCGHFFKTTINKKLIIHFLRNWTVLKGEITKSVMICYKCIHVGLFLHPHSHKLAIYYRKKCGQFKSGKFGLQTFLDFFHVCNNKNHKNNDNLTQILQLCTLAKTLLYSLLSYSVARNLDFTLNSSIVCISFLTWNAT